MAENSNVMARVHYTNWAHCLLVTADFRKQLKQRGYCDRTVHRGHMC